MLSRSVIISPLRDLCLLVVSIGLLAAGCSRPAPAPPPGVSVQAVVYGEAAGAPLLMDVYQPPAAPPRPAVLLFHGGGWYAGDKRDCAPEARELAAAGFVCFVPNYRLTDVAHFPAQVQDCCRAVRWVRAHAPEYGVDPGRLGAWGRSAGGYFALMVGVIEPRDFPDEGDPNRHLSARVQCVVSFYGPAEFRPPAQWPAVAMRAAYGFFGEYPDSGSEMVARASPAAHVSPDDSPVLLVHGDRDKLVPLQQSVLMKAALDQVAVENQLIVIKGASHNLNGARIEEKSRVAAQAVNWLRQHLSLQPVK